MSSGECVVKDAREMFFARIVAIIEQQWRRSM
jgi:hypothetical protein